MVIVLESAVERVYLVQSHYDKDYLLSTLGNFCYTAFFLITYRPFMTINRKISIAPMMDCTDRHYRYFMRLMSPQILLYTEMVTTGAIIHGDRERLLGYSEQEHPLALQLGGSNLQDLAACTKIAEDYGYDEVNLNVGCPSDRVQSGSFGACLMKEPELVAECVNAMQVAADIPVTVKTRIGVDDLDSYEHLCRFIDTVSRAGCQSFTLHARKAWLKGLSPKENREIPPLHYDTVYQLKHDFPQLEIIINGGIKNLSDIQTHLDNTDGVMIGREAYKNPYSMAIVANEIFGDDLLSRREVVMNYLPYMSKQLQQGVPLRHLSKHLIGLFQGQPGARAWRRYLSENAGQKHLGVDLVEQALDFL